MQERHIHTNEEERMRAQFRFWAKFTRKNFSWVEFTGGGFSRYAFNDRKF